MRLSCRVIPVTKSRAEEAARALGQTVTHFTEDAIAKRAEEVLAEHNRILLSERDFAAFAEAIYSPAKPLAKGSTAAAAEYEHQHPSQFEATPQSMPFVEHLASHHDRPGLDCGSVPLSTFLQRNARQNAERNLGVTHVVVAQRGDSKILGYYTLVTNVVEARIMPTKKPPSGMIGVVLLARLATDRSVQEQGLGRKMLLRAIYETIMDSRAVGIYALTLDAIDEDARAWYVRSDFGFQALLDHPNHLYVPIHDIHQLKQPALTDEI